MKQLRALLLIVICAVFSCKTETKNTPESINTPETTVPTETEPSTETKTTEETTKYSSEIAINPISHGTLVLEYNDLIIYIDPVGGVEAFKGQKKPDIILVTDIHGDHLSIETLSGLNEVAPKLVVPIAVKAKLPEELAANTAVVSNFQNITLSKKGVNLGIEGIPMYNLREEAKQYHTRDRGNGYVLTLGDERIYISGDTEDIPEMRALKDIDIAFVCMNLPYTMTVESAADAVLEFQPKVVYPYHYRGTNGLSDTSKFKDLVENSNTKIDVRLLNWYPNR